MPRVRGMVSEQVIQQVAATADTDVLNLPPLYDAVDPDALDALVSGMTEGAVSFTYAGHEVTVTSDETVTVDTLPSCAPPAEFAETDD